MKEIDLTDTEKKILKMLFEIGARIMDNADDVFINGYESVNRDTIFNLAQKLGIEYWS